ncbi:sensor histidine kinase [Streptomyces sp. NPDC014991]|uniref:sensor histidine kinase n=1 Tax=Streptomyces sp. NPDC014991 TaxID=3364935 RepID=UPI00370107E8
MTGKARDGLTPEGETQMKDALRRMSLRLRLGLAAAAAVAVAVSAVAMASWLITRQQLTDQLDRNLRNVAASPRYVQQLLIACSAESTASGQRNETPTPYMVQVVTPDGTICAAPDNQTFEVSGSDIAVARGVLGSAVHDATTQDGRKVRVSTTRPDMPPGMPGQYAVSIAQSLNVVEKPLNNLAFLLLMIAGIGVAGAATAGIAISRAGLRPVQDLTDVAERIAHTQDLTVRIPVHGKDEIARLSRTFNTMTETLAVSRDRQQQLIADAGHELRTPLTSLRANIQLLLRSHTSGRKIPEQVMRELLHSVESQVSELATLIADLQELSRPDANLGKEPVPVVALHEVASRALKRVKHRASGLDFTSELDEWYVSSDPAALERAVVNLLDNAVKFSPPGAAVSLQLRDGRLTVKDQGPGISADELPRVFDRFWRSPTARSLPGSGLGLAIVAKAVQQAGGTVTLQAAKPQGTEAIISIPGTRTSPPPICREG